MQTATNNTTVKTSSARKVTKKSSAPVKTATSEKNLSKAEGAIVLKAICQGLKLDTKTARRVLRKHMRSDRPEIGKFHTIGNRWIQNSKDAAVVKEVLKAYLAS
jgi:hypothetical protein